MKKYIAEFVGTFFLMFVIVLMASKTTAELTPVAVGAMLAGMAYAADHVSKAHFNPAVSLALRLRGKLLRTDFPYYILAQLTGAATATLISVFLLRSTGGPGSGPHTYDLLPALLAEFFGTFVLVYVLLSMKARPENESNLHASLAAGFTVMGLAFALTGISAAAFNPAVAIGMAIGEMIAWEDLWLYIVGNLLGAATAVTVFQLMYNNEL